MPDNELVLMETNRSMTTLRVRTLWTTQVLPTAVDMAIRQNCYNQYGSPHADCRAFMEYLTAQGQADQFYCLGEANTCGRCGTRWFGVLTHTSTGELIKARCPACYEAAQELENLRPRTAEIEARIAELTEPLEPLTLQRHTWTELVTEYAGELVGTMESNARRLVVGMCFELADHIVAVRLGNPQNLSDWQSQVTQRLRQFGLDGTDAFNAAQWAVNAPIACNALGIDYAATANWTYQQRRDAASTMMLVARQVEAGQRVDVEGIMAALAGSGTQEQRWRAASRAALGGTARSAAPEAPRLRGYMARPTSDRYVLVLEGPPQAIIDARSSLSIDLLGEISAEAFDQITGLFNLPRS